MSARGWALAAGLSAGLHAATAGAQADAGAVSQPGAAADAGAAARPSPPASEPVGTPRPSPPTSETDVDYPRGWNLYVPAIEYGGGLLGSALGAAAFGYAGGMIDNAVNGSCLLALGGCFPVVGFSAGAVVGQTLGSPVAVVLTGRLLHRHGSITGAFVGSAAGSAITVLTMVFSQRAQQSGLLFIALVATLLPPLGSMLGYDLFRDVDAEQQDLNERRGRRRRPAARNLWLPAVTSAVDVAGASVPVLGIVAIKY